MKKTIIALMALAGVAAADTLTYDQYKEAGLLTGLQAAWDFDSATADVLTFTVNNSFSVANGVGSVGNSNTPWANNSTDIATAFNTDEFTFSFDLLSYNSYTWKNAVSLYSGGNKNQMLAVTSDDNGILIYDYGFGGKANVSESVASLGALPADGSGMNITLTFKGKTLTTYLNGESVSTYTLTGDALKKGLTGFQFNCGFEGVRPAQYPGTQTLDNLAIWNKALTADQVSMIASGVIPQTPAVPEPATATLSLLALAGLAARRRRH